MTKQLSPSFPLCSLFARDGSISTALLRNNFNSPHLIQNEGRFEDLARSLVQSSSQSFDNFVTQDLSNHLFQVRKPAFLCNHGRLSLPHFYITLNKVLLLLLLLLLLVLLVLLVLVVPVLLVLVLVLLVLLVLVLLLLLLLPLLLLLLLLILLQDFPYFSLTIFYTLLLPSFLIWNRLFKVSFPGSACEVFAMSCIMKIIN